MADHAVEDDDNVFVYTGGRVPQHMKNIITHARIDESITEVDDGAFRNCPNLQSVDCHSEVERIGKSAFKNCPSMKRIKLPGVKTIDAEAFQHCTGLKSVKIGNKLETIGKCSFAHCTSLRRLKIHTVSSIELCAFWDCIVMTHVELPSEEGALYTIKGRAFAECRSLRRISLPLKEGLLTANTVFDDCDELQRVDLVGGIHETVSSLHLNSWRDEMTSEINRINRSLPFLCEEGIQTEGIQQWIQSVLRRISHFKTEHRNLLKEAMTLLELALWKAKLDVDGEEECSLESKTKRRKIDDEGIRKECRVTCGANIIIKNVLPFL